MREALKHTSLEFTVNIINEYNLIGGSTHILSKYIGSAVFKYRAPRKNRLSKYLTVKFFGAITDLNTLRELDNPLKIEDNKEVEYFFNNFNGITAVEICN